MSRPSNEVEQERRAHQILTWLYQDAKRAAILNAAVYDPDNARDLLSKTLSGPDVPSGIASFVTAETIEKVINVGVVHGNLSVNILAAARNTAAVTRYLRDLINETSARLEHMIMLAAVETLGIARTPPALGTFFSISPLQPYRDAEDSEFEGPALFNSFEAAFESLGRRVMLLGAPGSGKTTTILQFASIAAEARLQDPSRPIPILASIHRWPPGVTVKGWAESQVQTGWGFSVVGQQVVYLFDGLDELGDIPLENEAGPSLGTPDRRLTFLKAVDDCLSDAELVITCREEDFRKLKTQCPTQGAATLLPLRTEQIEEFLTSRDQKALWDVLCKDQELLRLVSSPLLLGLISNATGQNSHDFIDGLDQLNENSVFNYFIRQRFRHEQAKGFLPYDERMTRNLLGKLAAFMIEKGRTYYDLTLTDVQRIIGEEAQSFLDFATRMQFLRAPIPEAIDFIHLRFRDYCALEGLRTQIETGDENTRWRATTVLRHLGIGAASLPLLAIATRDGDIWIRWMAATALGDLGAVALPLLIPMIADPDFDVRWSAREAILNKKDVAVPALLKALTNANKTLLLKIVDLIGDTHDGTAAPRLVELLQDADLEVWERTTTALTRLEGVDRSIDVTSLVKEAILRCLQTE